MEKAAGSTTLNQSRTNNKVNEITDVSASTGDDWYDPTFDGGTENWAELFFGNQ